MSDPETDDDLEDRLDQLEDQIGDVSVQDLEDRLAAIERHQKRLESNIDALAQRTRQESDQTPDIDSVRRLYRSLEAIEEYMREVGEQVDDLTDTVDDE